jgi:hypothetical protein
MKFQFLLLTLGVALTSFSTLGCAGFENKVDEKVALEKPTT